MQTRSLPANLSVVAEGTSSYCRPVRLGSCTRPWSLRGVHLSNQEGEHRRFLLSLPFFLFFPCSLPLCPYNLQLLRPYMEDRTMTAREGDTFFAAVSFIYCCNYYIHSLPSLNIEWHTFLPFFLSPPPFLFNRVKKMKQCDNCVPNPCPFAHPHCPRRTVLNCAICLGSVRKRPLFNLQVRLTSLSVCNRLLTSHTFLRYARYLMAMVGATLQTMPKRTCGRRWKRTRCTFSC